MKQANLLEIIGPSLSKAKYEMKWFPLDLTLYEIYCSFH